MAVGIKQGIKLKAKNKNAKYKVKYTIAQTAKASNGRQTTKYSYSKKIVTKTKKYSYKR
jgi:hypothetical protein